MKKRMILITITLCVIAIGISVYITHRPSPLLSVHEHLPEPKSHEHTTPDGSTVQHIHTYDFAAPDTDIEKTVQPGQASDTKHPIQSAWERLDLNTIKKKYQPYTLAEMKEMWHHSFLDMFGPNLKDVEAAEEFYSLDEWLKDLMALGHPFMHSGHYNLALGRRNGLAGPSREFWDTGEPRYYPTGELMGGFSKAGLLKKLQLPSDTTYEEYVQMSNKFSVVRLINVLRAQELDPDVDGGVTSLDGSFLPFSPNLVNVHIDPETGRTKFIGPSLTDAEKDALVDFGIAPEGMSVVYIDANDKPIPVGKVPPRFFERNMKALETAQTLLQQQIEEHEFLLEMDTLLNPSAAKKQGTAVPHEHVHEQDPSHTHERAKDTAAATPQQRPNIDMKRLPPGIEIPPDIRTQEDIQRWFTALEALHGGQLPKDLRVLQQVITELEQVRQDAEKHLKPPPRPERPTPDANE